MNDRERKFANYARILYEDIYPMFYNLFMQEQDGNYQRRDIEAEQTRQTIHTYFAECGYDLVHNALDTPGICFSTGSYEVKFGITRPEFIYDTDEIMKHIPDMTAWPSISARPEKE